MHQFNQTNQMSLDLSDVSCGVVNPQPITSTASKFQAKCTA